MNGQGSMNCPRCGRSMTFKKFFDYGGHSWGWECIFCREIIDQASEIHLSAREDRNEMEKLRMRKDV